MSVKQLDKTTRLKTMSKTNDQERSIEGTFMASGVLHSLKTDMSVTFEGSNLNYFRIIYSVTDGTRAAATSPVNWIHASSHANPLNFL